MKAWLLADKTGLSALSLADHPDPVPAAGEVLVRVHFAALNPADRYLAENQYPAKPSFPHILGRDGAGTVEALGDGVPAEWLGRKVAILRGDTGVNRAGTLAELVSIPIDQLVDIPIDWSMEQAAAAPLVYLTAWQALTQWGIPAAGDCVLITGATGGVGIAAIHLAESMGLRTIGLSRDEEKRARLLAEGATEVFDPTIPTLVRDVRQFAGLAGVRVVVDSVGGAGLPPLLDTLGNQGAVSVVGMLAGPVPEFNTAKLFFKRLRIGGVSVGAYTPAEAQAIWQQIVSALARTKRRPVIDSVWKFEELLPAFERLARGPFGKVVIGAPLSRVAPAT